MKSWQFVLMATFFFIAGCGKRGDEKRLPVVGFKSIPDDAVLIQVEDSSITKAQFKALVDLKKHAMLVATPSAESTNKFDFVETGMLADLRNRFPREVALRKYAEVCGIQPGTNDIALCKAGFLSLCKQQGGKWMSVLKKFPTELHPVLEGRVGAESLERAVYRAYLADHPVKIVTNEVEGVLAKIEDYNRRAALTNATIWAAASNVWRKINAGMDFVNAARQYNEDETAPSPGVCAWGSFTEADLLQEGDVKKFVPYFMPGFVTPPVEGDNGLMIVKVESIDEEVVRDGVKVPHFNLSRIFFHLPEFIETLDRPAFYEEFRRVLEVKSLETFVDGLVKPLRVTYPYGTHVFDDNGNKAQK